jgi:polyhydroxyalkanoate synthesis regulator phasin
MTDLKDRLLRLLQDPRVAKLMQDPTVQRLVMKGLRLKGRIDGELGRRMQRIAGSLNLATQRDLRSLQRRIRHLEQELRETEERLTETEDAREAAARN